MRFAYQHIAQAEILFNAYEGQEPLHLYLKKFFKRNKKFGSRDRKQIAEFLYAAYRLGRENRHLDFKMRVGISLWLKGALPEEFFDTIYPNEFSLEVKGIGDKLAFVQEKYDIRKTFRAIEEIDQAIDVEAYRLNFYQEQKVFVRLRNNIEKYKTALKEDGEWIAPNAMAFGAKTKVETLIEAQDYVVQDINSQRTADYFPILKEGDKVWDCCAGSGGKSILLLDKQPAVHLTLTDIRATILEQLIERFERYDLGAELLMELNVNKQKEVDKLEQAFDFILCDVPCTGSGTWARTPENFYFFDKKSLKKYHRQQLDILSNTSQKLKQGKELLYITCSVFTQENETVVNAFLERNPNFTVQAQSYLDGTKGQGDSLFVCRLKKES